MKQPPFKSTVLGLAIAAIALLGGILTACSSSSNSSTPSQAETANPAVTTAGEKQMQGGMNHGDMNHGGMGGMNHNMELGPADAEFDLRFIDAMIPHHQGGVVMAKEVQQKSQRPELKKLADQIIKAQTQEIAQMKTWRTAWYPQAPSQPIAWHSKMGHSMAMSDQQKQAMMMSMDLGAADTQFDLRFINAMIPHHQGAVVMAKEALSKSKHPEIKQLAQSIIASQQAEIDQMKQWRKTWYNQ